MKWILLIVAVVVILAVIAWVSSGRAKPRSGYSAQMSDVEKDDAMRQNQRWQQGAGGGFN
jgi:hypothetical protein